MDDTLKEFYEFRAYCATCTDEQLLKVVDRERENCASMDGPHRGAYFSAACDEAAKRGIL